jgi:hypothetical protein
MRSKVRSKFEFWLHPSGTNQWLAHDHRLGKGADVRAQGQNLDRWRNQDNHSCLEDALPPWVGWDFVGCLVSDLLGAMKWGGAHPFGTNLPRPDHYSSISSSQIPALHVVYKCHALLGTDLSTSRKGSWDG